MMKDVVEDKSSEFFRCFKNNREIESMYEQNNANTNFSKSISHENDDYTAIRQTSLKSANSKSLKCYGEARIKKKRKVLYENEANEDREYLNILSNLVNICSHNEDIHKFLKRLQLFALETEQNQQISLKNISDLVHRPNSQPEQKFSDFEEIFCSSKNILKQNRNLFNENLQEFTFDNQVNGNKETGTIKLNLMRQEEVFSGSTERTDKFSSLSSKLIQAVEVECGSIKPSNLRNGKTHNLFTEIVNANEAQKPNLNIPHSEDIAAISDPIDREQLISCNNTNGFKTLKKKIVTSHTFGIFSGDKECNSVSIHKNSSIKQIIDHRFTDICDKNNRISAFTVDCGSEKNILLQRTSGKLEICDRGITPLSTKCMDNGMPSGDYKIMETSKLTVCMHL